MKRSTSPLSAKARDNLIKGFKEACKVAEDLNIKLVLELLNRYETNVMNTGKMVTSF